MTINSFEDQTVQRAKGDLSPSGNLVPVGYAYGAMEAAIAFPCSTLQAFLPMCR
jgi:hypothetical protein